MKRLAAVLAFALTLAGAAAAGPVSRHMTIKKTDSGLKGALHAEPPCYADQLVKVQRKSSSGWRTVTKTRTNDEGKYRKRLDLKDGVKYRTLAPESAAGDTICARVVSDGTVTG